jgi:hypothetical protein
MRVAHNADVIQASEEYKCTESRRRFFGGPGQNLPEFVRRSSLEINA